MPSVNTEYQQYLAHHQPQPKSNQATLSDQDISYKRALTAPAAPNSSRNLCQAPEPAPRASKSAGEVRRRREDLVLAMFTINGMSKDPEPFPQEPQEDCRSV
mmetsp:Transcript_9007/g.31891  ORF Transcript_9007/g.31891 Transcript_9007/m.31891 type:complete len:102 (+) Transcript_9007:80-385(+)